jgi:hypothetical protein
LRESFGIDEVRVPRAAVGSQYEVWVKDGDETVEVIGSRRGEGGIDL